MIEVVDYDPEWANAFEQIRDGVWPQINHIAVGCEHVGSTSVPGLPAKPIIDIDVVIPSRALRDHLRAHPNDCAAYAALKRRLAALCDDVNDYSRRKTDLIVSILQNYAFSDEELGLIRRANE
jgi:GrpB-like predicted nucleotidyltransferase (UPF0157 family)